MKFAVQAQVALSILLGATSAHSQVNPGLGAANALALSANGHVVVNNAPALGNAFTFEAWVRLPDTAGHYTILSRGAGNSPTSPADYIFQVLPGGLVGCFAVGAWNYSAQALLGPDAWTHLAVTFDGTHVRFYRNGALRHSTARAGALQPPDVNEPLFLGRQGSACACNFLNGELDEVRIWNVARTDGEIAANYHRSVFGDAPGLAALFRFDDVDEATVANGANADAPGRLTGNASLIVSGAGFADGPPRAGLVVAPIANGDSALRGTILCGGQPTQVWFEASTNPDFSFSLQSAPTELSTELATISATAGVPPGSWLARVVASNALGVTTAEAAFVSQPFVNIPIAGLRGFRNARVAWAQLNNLGGPEFLVCGNPESANPLDRLQCWQNSNLGFTRLASLQAFSPGSSERSDWLAPADYDNDGWLDFVYSGPANSSSGLTLWRNQPFSLDPSFEQVAFPASGNIGAVAWADFDNNGWQDILATGLSGSSVAELWQNTGNSFVSVPLTGVPGVALGDVAWADYDNDGWPDFILLGRKPDASLITQLWRNTGHGFQNVTDTAFPPGGLPGVVSGAVAWADYDNDGRLDFLLTGSRIAQLWRNTDLGFTNVPIAGLPGVEGSAAAWADYDNNGWPDFILLGQGPDGPIAQLWQNTGTRFAPAAIPGLPGVQNGSAAWGDYDNDGRIDLLLAGSGLAQLWRNRTTARRSLEPTAPTGLAMTATPDGVMFSWNAATDAQTPSSGLSYNVRAGTQPGGIDLLSPQSNPVSGFRRIPALGNAQLRRFMFLNGVTNGQTIYWSVQAVDPSFAGGPWASETSVLSQPQLTVTPEPGGLARVSWSPPTSGWRLQESPLQLPNSWSNTPGGELNPALVPTTDGQKFFRLLKP